jgi:signal transduction histidine kinase
MQLGRRLRWLAAPFADLDESFDPDKVDPATLARDETLEAGLLPITRLVLAIQLLLQVIGFSLQLLLDQPAFVLKSNGNPLAVRYPYSLWMTLAQLLTTGAITCYIFWPGLPQRMGRRFLPLLIGVLTLVAMVSHGLLLQQIVTVSDFRALLASQGRQIILVEAGWGMFVSLLLPVVLVAWQYDFRAVVAYVIIASAATLMATLLALYGFDAYINAGLYIVPARAILWLIVGYIVTRMIGAQRRQRDGLVAANLRLRQMAETQEQLAVSRERNRLARELHDTLAHSLSAVSVQLEAIDSALDARPETARHLVSKALAQTRSGLAETRRALHELRASPLEDLGLPLALRSLAESAALRAGAELTLELPAEDPGLPPLTEQGLYRVAQEALNNAVRHGRPTRLHMGLVVNGAVTLTVRDNGRGFDPQTVDQRSHFGLRGLQERAGMLGATLELQSAPGAGSTIIFRCRP